MPLEEQTIQIPIVLQRNTTYFFEMRMCNAAGWSPFSDRLEVSTSQPIPGRPQNVRLSSKRTSKSLKLRWEPPDVYPEAVHEYSVLVRNAKALEWKEKKSFMNSMKFPNLESYEEYHFQVRALNSIGEAGDWKEIKGKTPLSNVARGFLCAAAGVGGTLFGPVLGASSGYNEAKDLIDPKHKEKRVLAGIAGSVAGVMIGTIGAPLMGYSTACAVYKSTGCDETSPQTSDSEG